MHEEPGSGQTVCRLACRQQVSSSVLVPTPSPSVMRASSPDLARPSFKVPVPAGCIVGKWGNDDTGSGAAIWDWWGGTVWGH